MEEEKGDDSCLVLLVGCDADSFKKTGDKDIEGSQTSSSGKQMTAEENITKEYVHDPRVRVNQENTTEVHQGSSTGEELSEPLDFSSEICEVKRGKRAADHQRCRPLKRLHTDERVSEHGSPSSPDLPVLFKPRAFSGSFYNADPLTPEKSPVVFEGASCNTGENPKKDTRGFPVQSESKTSSDHSALEEGWPHDTVVLLPSINSPPLWSNQISSSKYETFPAELRSQSETQMMRKYSSAAASAPRVLMGNTTEVHQGSRTGKERSDYLEIISKLDQINREIRAAHRQRIQLLGRLRDSKSVSEHGWLSSPDLPVPFKPHAFSGSFYKVDPLTPEKSPEVHKGASSDTGENPQKDTCGFPVHSESKTSSDHDALEEMEPPVTVKQHSSKSSSDSFGRRIVDSQPSMSQKSSSKSKTIPAANSSSDKLYRDIYKEVKAFIETHSVSATDSSDSMLDQPLLRSHSGKQVMRKRSSAAASTLRHPKDNTTEVHQGSRTGNERSDYLELISKKDKIIRDITAADRQHIQLLGRLRDSKSVSEHGWLSSPNFPVPFKPRAFSGSFYKVDPLTPEKSPVVHEGASSDTGENPKKDTWGFPVHSESKTSSDHDALEEMEPPVTVKQHSSKSSSDSFGRRIVDSQPSMSQKSSSKSKTIPAANSSSDKLYRDIYKEVKAFIETHSVSATDSSDSMLDQPLLRSHSGKQVMRKRSSAAASTLRHPKDNTTEVHQGSRTGNERSDYLELISKKDKIIRDITAADRQHIQLLGRLRDSKSVSEHGWLSSPNFPVPFKPRAFSGSFYKVDPLTPEKSPVVHEGASSDTGENPKKDTWGFPVHLESKTSSDHGALEEMEPPVTVEQRSSKNSSDSFGRRIVDSQPSLSQKSSSKSKTIPAANSSSDKLYRDISEEVKACIETHSLSATDSSYSMFHQPRPSSHSRIQVMSKYSSAAASAPRVPEDNTTEVHQGSRTGKERSDYFDLCSEIYKINREIRAAELQRRWLLERLESSPLRILQDNTPVLLQGSSTGEELRERGSGLSALRRSPALVSVSAQGRAGILNPPVLSNQSACSQFINTSDADSCIACQSHAWAYHEHLRRRYTHDLYSSRTLSDKSLLIPNITDTDDGGPILAFYSSPFTEPSCSQSIAPTVAGPPCPQGRPTVIQDSTVCTEGSGAQDALQLFFKEPESELGGGGDVLLEMDSPVTAVNYSVTNTLPERGHLQPPWSRRDSSCLSRSQSMPSLSQITSAEITTLRRAESVPDALLKSSSEEFTPDVTTDENDDETFRFRCSCPGLYRCSVTGLVFHMGGEGDVVYRTVPWNWRLLVQHRKKPAGPLFDIKCEQWSMRGLHLPHCEIRSTGGCDFLSVAHVKDEGIEFIRPNKTTETHVVISITGFSAFGNVKDEDSPPDLVRALVLLFYRPPADPDSEYLLNVLLLPRNVVLPDVLRIRKKTVGDESYIETSPHCKLHPKQEYTLSTSPEDHQVLVQPTEAEFDCDNYDNYFTSFQVTWEATLKHIKLVLRDTNSSQSVRERRVCLSAAGVRSSCGPSSLNRSACERLRVTRIGIIEGISGPVLKSLLDKLFEKTVITDSERESADEEPNRRDKARVVVDTVRKKGEAASSEMIEILCEADPFLCEHLGLI